MNRFRILIVAVVALLAGCPSQPTQTRTGVPVSSVSGITRDLGGDVAGADAPSNPDRKLVKAVQSTATRQAAANAACALLNSGTARLYSGAAKGSQDANGSVASLTGTLIATWSLASTAFTVSGGVCTLAGVPLSATAAATAALSASNTTSGYIVFITSASAISVVASAGLTGSGAEMIFDVQPQSGGTVNLTGYTRTFPAGS